VYQPAARALPEKWEEPQPLSLVDRDLKRNSSKTDGDGKGRNENKDRIEQRS
jgi:hypothetical protein